MTKLDILDPEAEIPVCVAYELDGKRIDTVPASVEQLARVKPVYQKLPGWKSSLAACRTFESLHANAQSYVQFIEREVGVPVRWIGTGPGRDEIVICP